MQQHPRSLPRRARLLGGLAAALLGGVLVLAGAAQGTGGPAGVLAAGDPLGSGSGIVPKEVNSTAGFAPSVAPKEVNSTAGFAPRVA